DGVLAGARRRVTSVRRRRLLTVVVALVVLVGASAVLFTRFDHSKQEVKVVTTPSSPASFGIPWSVNRAVATAPLGSIPGRTGPAATPTVIASIRVWVYRDGDLVNVFRDDAQHLAGERLWYCPN